MISREREWNGIASTTQLLNGTMLEYLKLTKPYSVSPDSRAFMLSGTRHHVALDAMAKELGIPSEVAMNVDRDIFDLLEIENGIWTLTDYKLWGSFKIAKATGIVQGDKIPSQTEVYKTSGKWGKAGSPKMINTFRIDPARKNNWEAELQLNRYRVMLNQRAGIKVGIMRLQVTARDGGLGIASSRGITHNTWMIPIPVLPDDAIEIYFDNKQKDLAYAIKNGWTIPCNTEETWEGRRCNGYCDVSHYCPQGTVIQQDNEEGIL
jgi:hypothetical protein